MFKLRNKAKEYLVKEASLVAAVLQFERIRNSYKWSFNIIFLHDLLVYTSNDDILFLLE